MDKNPQDTFSFDIIARDDKFPLARAGVIHTPHGDIKTPTFNVVGTFGEVRFVNPMQLASTGAQVMLSNGYHLFNRATKISVAGGLANYSGWKRPTFTDSGGFQVMSLGSGLGKVISMEIDNSAKLTEPDERLARVDDEGVEFRDPFSSRIIKFTPELSIQTQHKIGADVMMSFDELTNICDSYEYNERALKRTNIWARRGLIEHIKQTKMRADRPYQALYGVLQGSYYLDLRRKAANEIANMAVDGWGFDGFGLGGVLEKQNLGEIIAAMTEILPEYKPRHLLGLSHPDDIFVGVSYGADTFDCVAPTREARHGRIYTLDGNYNLKQAIYKDDNNTLMQDCDCSTCISGISRSTLRALLKSTNSTDHGQAYTLTSVHNIRFIMRLVEQIRQALIDGNFSEFKDAWLGRYYHN